MLSPARRQVDAPGCVAYFQPKTLECILDSIKYCVPTCSGICEPRSPTNAWKPCCPDALANGVAQGSMQLAEQLQCLIVPKDWMFIVARRDEQRRDATPRRSVVGSPGVDIEARRRRCGTASAAGLDWVYA